MRFQLNHYIFRKLYYNFFILSTSKKFSLQLLCLIHFVTLLLQFKFISRWIFALKFGVLFRKGIFTMGASIYIADDEKNIRDLITKFLECDGYSVTAFETGDELMEEFLKKPCELVILDIMMPGTDGLTICRQLRTITDVPIIMLTAKDSEYDYVRGITLGGDDYLTKPFRLTTLLMRVKSLLRRMDMNTKKVTCQELSDIKIGNLRFSAQENCLYCKGKPVSLSKTELKMLTYMLKEPKKAFSREEILEGVWGFDTEVETRVTDETLRRIRRKLSLAGSNVSIGTIWGFGYRISIAEDKK